MTPLTRDCVASNEHLTVHDDAAARARADNHREHHAGAGGRAIGRLGQGQAIRVVREAHRTSEHARKIVGKGTAVHPGGVGVLDEAGGRRDRPRNADADRPAGTRVALDAANERHDR